MRLHSLELVGIGPFRERQVIDFDALSAHGLFLVDGPTGAGKTTIIDSIVFALYGAVSGSDSDGSRMRSNRADANEPSLVICEFSVGGRRHRIERSPKYLRAPKRGSGSPVTQAEQRRLVEFDAANAPVVEITGADEVGSHITELLGMSADQFRKLVVLPQGEFAALLRMSSADRLKALEPILGDDFYKQVQVRVQQLGQEAERERADAHSTVRAAAVALHGALGSQREMDGFPDDSVLRDDSASEAELLAAADVAMRWLAEQSTLALQDAAAQRRATDAAQARERELRDALQSLVALGHAERSVSTARASLAEADRDLGDDVVDTRIAEFQRRLGEVQVHAEWESAAGKRRADREAGAEALANVHARQAELAVEGENLPTTLAAVESALNDARASAAQSSTHAAEVARLEQLERDLSALETLERECAEADRTSDAAREAEARLISAVASAQAAERAMRAQHLAAMLVEGQPCPVCGAEEHPSPATGASDDVDIDAMDELAASLNEARDVLTAAIATGAAKRGRMEELRGRVPGDVDAMTCAAHLATASASLRVAEAAAASLDSIEAECDRLRVRSVSLAADSQELATQASAIEATLRAHDEAEQARVEQIAAVIGDHGSATALAGVLHTRIDALQEVRAALNALGLARAALPEGIRGRAEAEFEGELTEATAQRIAADEVQARLDERVMTLADAVHRCAPLAAELGRTITQGAVILERTRTAIALGSLVGGANARSLPLRAYAMQLRFRSVLDAASHHLLRMSQGKYEFELSEESTRGHSGLGIAIRDHWAGAVREPKSLSGGETFYASLALALGLAEVVQAEAGGSELETLFVDEGFGSLDTETLDLVLDQLDRLRSGGRIVGVVSHVTEMKDAIPDRIEVQVRPDRTSTTVVTALR